MRLEIPPHRRTVVFLPVDHEASQEARNNAFETIEYRRAGRVEGYKLRSLVNPHVTTYVLKGGGAV